MSNIFDNINKGKKMNYNAIIVRYGEISLKGKNRDIFETRLKNNIKDFLDLHKIEYTQLLVRRGRIYIHGIQALPELKKVFGILSYSRALLIPRDLEQLKTECRLFLPAVAAAESFRVSCQRVDKRFPFTSIAIERLIGEMLYDETKKKVNLEHPDLNCQIEIGEEGIYLFYEKIPAFGGMPYGTAGKLVSLISSGIDSPVATFMMMKRGVEPILLHFSITEEDTAKLLKLKTKLEEYTSGKELKLIVIPRDELFGGKFGRLYHSERFHSYMCVLCKYLMHKKAGVVAEQEGAHGVISGDNLAQVASQTLKNFLTYRLSSGYPVYSPLISFDKQETIAIAKNIGTYDISIISATGCMPPKSPKTGVPIKIFQRILHESGLVNE